MLLPPPVSSPPLSRPCTLQTPPLIHLPLPFPSAAVLHDIMEGFGELSAEAHSVLAGAKEILGDSTGQVRLNTQKPNA